jgi:hypothetical protein
MTQQFYTDTGDPAPPFTPPPRPSSNYAASQLSTGTSQDDDPPLPPGWEAYRSEDNRPVYFHKATQQIENNLHDLFKKKPPPASTTIQEEPNRRQSAPGARIMPPADFKFKGATPHPKKETRRPPKSEQPRPDAASSSCIIVLPTISPSKIITRVPGVVDLLSTTEDDEDEDEDEDETDLEAQLPQTAEFDPNHYSDGAESDDEESDDESAKSQSLLD